MLKTGSVVMGTGALAFSALQALNHLVDPSGVVATSDPAALYALIGTIISAGVGLLGLVYTTRNSVRSQQRGRRMLQEAAPAETDFARALVDRLTAQVDEQAAEIAAQHAQITELQTTIAALRREVATLKRRKPR